MSVSKFLQHYKSKGFNFSNKVLTKYCLSLYTKPFVILSGISGTGKTKIAQLFDTFEADTSDAVVIPTDIDYIILNLTKGVMNEDGRGNFQFKKLRALFEEDEIPEIQKQIDEKKRKGSDDNIIAPQVFTIQTGEGDIKVGIYLQRASSPLVRVRFISKHGDAEAYDSQKFLREHYNQGDVLKLEKIGKRRLKITSVNNDDVIQSGANLEREQEKIVENKLFISVKSNWTDSTELFGHYNVLEEKYNLTPMLKFMLQAREHPNIPFFLILDEMNLSKVEHYFSDFLSCLESRIDINGKIQQEHIRLHNYSDYINSNDTYFDVVPPAIEIPRNFYVTGTVNIDETTYAFSPKVLDRANVIEFNEVTIAAYNGVSSADRFSLTTFPKFGMPIVANSQAYNESPELYKACIQQLLDILQPYNLHFGYRVINEMAAFVNNAVVYVGNEEQIIKDAIDIQIAQKVLPKFNGAFGKLDEPIRKLIHFMIDNIDLGINDINIDFVATVKPEETVYPESLSKLIRLYTNLIFNGFASFLE